jgi:hypothetical protein
VNKCARLAARREREIITPLKAERAPNRLITYANLKQKQARLIPVSQNQIESCKKAVKSFQVWRGSSAAKYSNEHRSASYQSQKWQRERECRGGAEWYWIKIIGNQSGDIELSKEPRTHACSDYDHSLTNDYNINTGPPEICRLIYSGRRAGTQSASCRYHQLACQDWFERLIFCSSRYNGHWCLQGAARWSRTPTH